MPKVFISYSHDTEAHATRVLALANKLRKKGVDSIIDQFIEAPPEGWNQWIDRQIAEADFII